MHSAGFALVRSNESSGFRDKHAYLRVNPITRAYDWAVNRKVIFSRMLNCPLLVQGGTPP